MTTFDLVTITALPASTDAGTTALLNETFGGLDGAAWPTGWSLFVAGGAALTDIRQQGGAGRMTLPNLGGYPGMAARRDLDVADLDMTFTVAGNFDASSAAAAEHYREIQFRLSPTADPSTHLSDCYYVSIYPSLNNPTTSPWNLTLNRRENGVQRALAPSARVVGPTVRTMKGRIRAVGRTIRVRLWAADTLEPTSWHITYTDDTATARLGRGSVAFAAFGGNAASASRYVDWDNLVVTGALPTPTISASGPAQSVFGDEILLSAFGTNYTSMTWEVVSSPDGLTEGTFTGADTETPTFTPTKAGGTYTFRVTARNATSSASALVPVEVVAQMWQRTATGKRPVVININTVLTDGTFESNPVASGVPKGWLGLTGGTAEGATYAVAQDGLAGSKAAVLTLGSTVPRLARLMQANWTPCTPGTTVRFPVRAKGTDTAGGRLRIDVFTRTSVKGEGPSATSEQFAVTADYTGYEYIWTVPEGAVQYQAAIVYSGVTGGADAAAGSSLTVDEFVPAAGPAPMPGVSEIEVIEGDTTTTDPTLDPSTWAADPALTASQTLVPFGAGPALSADWQVSAETGNTVEVVSGAARMSVNGGYTKVNARTVATDHAGEVQYRFRITNEREWRAAFWAAAGGYAAAYSFGPIAGYRWELADNGSWTFGRNDQPNEFYTTLVSSEQVGQARLTVVTGDVLTVAIKPGGSGVTCRVWKDSQTRETAPVVITTTDTTYTAGRLGFGMQGGNSSSGVTSLEVARVIKDSAA